ncbi:hypothetical protein EST92_09685 [Streptomyces sp. TM32]|uniref:hypothetical protein n=1 Tax=Streptomyces sp. TM32 TaxID=1652669 RepID=UPI001010326C|nr:hypothetical protein [Streptomyces sp. TM32]RXS84871.1 hypothetical protein EST92_09685 [Streptomyces sp. TM32]
MQRVDPVCGNKGEHLDGTRRSRQAKVGVVVLGEHDHAPVADVASYLVIGDLDAPAFAAAAQPDPSAPTPHVDLVKRDTMRGGRGVDGDRHQLQRGTSDRIRYQRVNERTGGLLQIWVTGSVTRPGGPV